MHCNMIFSNEIFMIEASKVNEMLENLPLKWTKFVLDIYIYRLSFFWEFENESWEWKWEFSWKNWKSRPRMRREFSLRVSQKSAIAWFMVTNSANLCLLKIWVSKPCFGGTPNFLSSLSGLVVRKNTEVNHSFLRAVH